MDEWICSCGQKNTSKFCTRCGKAKAIIDLSKPDNEAWICSCGNKNTGAFCTKCGSERTPSPSNEINRSTNSQINLIQSTYPPKQASQPTESSIQSHGIRRNYVIIGLIIVIIGLVGTIAYLLQKDEPEKIVTDTPPTKFEYEQKNEQMIEQVAPAPKPKAKVNSSDLSLGKISIDSSKEQVYALLGLENQITDPEFTGHLHYQYPNMEVVITRDVVTAFVSKTAQVTTSRGIHQGSALRDVITAYGENYSSFEYEGSILYEYPFISTNGKNCLLRFAVKGGIVDYISGRVTDKIESDPYNGARETFLEYHKFITERKYDNAYDILSPKQKERHGNFNDFVNGYKNTISSEVERLGVRSIDGKSVSIEYTLIARDRQNSDKVKIQTFRGEAILVYRDSRWFIDYAKSSKVSEHIK